MPEALELLREGRHRELWDKCCGFIDLSMEQFMTIQRRRLLEQIRLVAECELGKQIMRGGVPWTVEEFRELVPLTTYADYGSYFLERQEDVLPEKPFLWQRTSGRSGQSGCQWVPVTRRMYEELGDVLLAVLIFATCRDRGDIAFELPVRFLYGMAPPPYATGTWGRRVGEEQLFEFLPPLEEAETMAFEDRIRKGFKLALSHGLDVIFGASSVLVAFGEKFGQSSGPKNLLPFLSEPRALARLAKAWFVSKVARRPMLPKDAWPIKGLASSGTDATIYREKVKRMWGRYPLDLYGRTEAGIIAMQTWDYQTMTFVPHLNFLEFLPESERYKLVRDSGYQPRTLLLDEVRPGENYELVMTSFLGGPFVRYRIGDIVSIASLRNERLGINLPQMAFVARADGLIDIAGFTRLTEKTIWQALEESQVAYADWTIRKELKDKPVLHLYLELKDGAVLSESQVGLVVHERLRALDEDYASLEDMLGLHPLEVTLVPNGSFARYTSKQRAAGADLVHLKPPHLNPSDAEVYSLLNA